MTTAANAAAGTRAPSRPRFYFYMALLCAVTAFGGFLPTFWLPMTHGHYVAAPIIAIHGFFFSCWTLFFILQTWFAASGRIANHRAWAFSEIALASVMTVFGFLVVINQMQRAGAAGNLDAGLSFAILPLWHVVLFATFVALAITNIRRPDRHKRFMLVATILILDAPIARPFIYFLGFHGNMPVAAGLPAPPPPIVGVSPNDYVVDFFLLIPILYDWRTRGRPHLVYLLGGGIVVLMELLQGPISRTQAWHGIASWIFRSPVEPRFHFIQDIARTRRGRGCLGGLTALLHPHHQHDAEIRRRRQAKVPEEVRTERDQVAHQEVDRAEHRRRHGEHQDHRAQRSRARAILARGGEHHAQTEKRDRRKPRHETERRRRRLQAPR